MNNTKNLINNGRATNENYRKIKNQDDYPTLETMDDDDALKKFKKLLNFKISGFLKSFSVNEKISHIAKETGISESSIKYWKSGSDKKNIKPKRENILKIGVVLGCNEAEINQMLKLCGYRELYARDKTDVIFIWGLYHGKSMEEINEKLKNTRE